MKFINLLLITCFMSGLQGYVSAATSATSKSENISTTETAPVQEAVSEPEVLTEPEIATVPETAPEANMPEQDETESSQSLDTDDEDFFKDIMGNIEEEEAK